MLNAIRTIGLATVVVLLCAACSESEQPDQPVTTERSDQLRTDALGREIELAIDHLVARSRIARNDVEISAAEFVTWSDGSLGCPQDGMAYTMALVPGYRILLMANGQPHHYHGAREQDPFFCPAERASQPLPARDTQS
ncbi:MAG: hypothetical protein AAGH65_10050 [Pseudomonadota bacterium]